MNDAKIHALCKRYRIRNYTINEDGSIDVDGDVDLTRKGLTKLPLRFNKVTGDFYCFYNKLTNLKRCPIYVGGNFNCHSNELITLKWCPKFVGGDFNCCNNRLITLKWAPTAVTNGDFNCYGNELTLLEGAPLYVGDCFRCGHNPLTTLHGIPYTVIKDVDCDNIKELWDASSDVFKVRHARDNWVIRNNLWNV